MSPAGVNLINHEVGHAFGLCDGGPGKPPDDPNCVPMPCYGDPTIGVMHAHGCSARPDWPSGAERAAVESMVPPPEGNSGGKGLELPIFY
jgi:hypothetical protein